MADAQPAEKKRSKRMYVYWGVALSLLLALGLFCWLVVVPVLRIPTEISRVRTAGFNEEFLVFPDTMAKESIRRLGEPARAGLALRIYLRLSSDSPEDRNVVVFLMGYCGRHTVPALINELDSAVPHRFSLAVGALGNIGPDAAEAVPALVACMLNRNSLECCWIAETLAEIGPAANAAVPALGAALEDEDSGLRCLAAHALGEIGAVPREVMAKIERLAVDDKSKPVRQAAAEALKKIRDARKEK